MEPIYPPAPGVISVGYAKGWEGRGMLPTAMPFGVGDNSSSRRLVVAR